MPADKASSPSQPERTGIDSLLSSANGLQRGINFGPRVFVSIILCGEIYSEW